MSGSRPGCKENAAAAIYATGWAAALLVASPYLAVRAIAEPREMRERFGGWSALPESAKGGILLHAASVGEARASMPLLAALADRGLQTVVSVMTPAARAREEELSTKGVAAVRFAPLDFAPFVERIFTRMRPAAVLVLETEIWLARMHAAARRNLPLAFVSARLSERGWRRTRPLRPLLRGALAHAAVAAQTEHDAQRFRDLGVHAERVRVTGNVKYHAPRGPLPAEQRAALRNGWRRLIVIGSARFAEAAQIAATLDASANISGPTLWVIVPRHPQRSLPALRKTIGDRLPLMIRSEAGGALIPPPSAFDSMSTQAVLIVATIGELPGFYAVADAAVVGGTFCPIEGHNLFEPAELGVPVFFGPHTANVADVAEVLLSTGGGRRAADGRDLARALSELLSNAENARAASAAALEAARSLGGAARRTLAALESWGFPGGHDPV